MKTICTKNDHISIHIFDDEYSLERKENKIFVYDSQLNAVLIISNSNLYYIYSDVTPPYNWESRKYLYTKNGGWFPNPSWKSTAYESLFEVLISKHLQLIQCLHEKSIIDDDNLLLLTESKSLKTIIDKYKLKYENPMSQKN